MVRRTCILVGVSALVVTLALVAGWKAPVRGQATPPKKEVAEDPVPPLLESVGLLGALQLYQTYLNIGFLADARAERLYDEKATQQLLDSIMTPLESVEKQLGKVQKWTRTKEDREAIDKLKNIAVLLRQQGKGLETFWNSGKEADGARYEATRKKAWAEINSVLVLEKSK